MIKSLFLDSDHSNSCKNYFSFLCFSFFFWILSLISFIYWALVCIFFSFNIFFFFWWQSCNINRNCSIREHWDNIICFWCYQNHFYPLSTSFSFKCAKSYEPLLVTNDFWFSRYPRHLVGMLAEYMLVGFHLRQMNRLVSTFFFPVFDTNIDLLSYVAGSGYII